MRVLITTDSFPPGCGGSGWSTFELARGLRSAGHEVAILRVRTARPAHPVQDYDGFAVEEHAIVAPPVPFVRNYLKNERACRRLVPVVREAIRQAKADVVHAQHVLTAPPSVAAARLEGVPVVCTIRDYWPVCYWSDLIHDPGGASLCPGCTGAMMQRCIRPRAGWVWPLALPFVPYMRANLRRKQDALRAADAIIAVSSVLARDLSARAPRLHDARIDTIPNPVDTNAIARSAHGAHPLDGRPYALYVGKLARNKGVASLVPAVERARLPWPLVVIGDGPERGALESTARRSPIDIRLLGWLEREQALGWIAHASVVVFPSYGPESLSRVLLESAVLGRAVAAMDTGGTRDIIVDGETGLLADSADRLGDAVARLISDPALAAALGRRAAAFVVEHFDAASVTARVAGVYCRVMAVPRTGSAHG